MNNSGDEPDLLVRARTVLLDALDALAEHRDSVIVIGAQAVYLHTGGIDVAVAETTKDSDVALDTRRLGPDPTIDAAMIRAGFHLNLETDQPGSWVSSDRIPVDIMVPEAIAGSKGRRGARIPPHSKSAARRARGLEAAVIDCAELPVRALDPRDPRVVAAKVAGPAALLVAKCHKITERAADSRRSRLSDKDAYDIFRILRRFETGELVEMIRARV